MRLITRMILLVSTCLLILGCEREGHVTIDDCKEIVQLKTDHGWRPLSYVVTEFTCMYERTTDNKAIIGGVCIARENALFHAGCVRAALYQRESDIHCGPHRHALHDGQCYCDDGYTREPMYGRCLATATKTGTAGVGDIPERPSEGVASAFVAPVTADDIAAMRATLPAGVTRTDAQIASIIRHKREEGPTGGSVR